MTDEKNKTLFFVKDDFTDSAKAFRINVGQRFIQDQNLGWFQEGADQGKALGFTAGIIFHAIIAMPPVWLDDLQAMSSCLP